MYYRVGEKLEVNSIWPPVSSESPGCSKYTPESRMLALRSEEVDSEGPVVGADLPVPPPAEQLPELSPDPKQRE